MKQTILLVGHGSRAEEGNRELVDWAMRWAKEHPEWEIVTCYIEFAEVLLEEGLDQAAAKGGSVLVLPLILNAAGHAKMEIPEALEAARLRHPKVNFIYARHIGADPLILTLMLRQLKSLMAELYFPDPKTTGVILLGRGSSDMAANSELAKLARWILESSEHELVDLAFTGISYPRIETAVMRQVKLGMMQVAILPFYLFEGRLMQRIGRQAEALQVQYPQIRFGVGPYIGFEPEIFALAETRVKEALGQKGEALLLECDGCSYREASAQASPHSHTHR